MTTASIIAIKVLLLIIYVIVGLIWGAFCYEQQSLRNSGMKKKILAYMLNMFFWIISIPIAFNKYHNVSDDFNYFLLRNSKHDN